jgi:hypothetical protein
MINSALAIRAAMIASNSALKNFFTVFMPTTRFVCFAQSDESSIQLRQWFWVVYFLQKLQHGNDDSFFDY